MCRILCESWCFFDTVVHAVALHCHIYNRGIARQGGPGVRTHRALERMTYEINANLLSFWPVGYREGRGVVVT